MIEPQHLFEDPETYLDFIQGDNTECEFFDRKEIRNDSTKNLDHGRQKIRECISAFANHRGGVLVLGIDDDGVVIGLEHLNENEYNSLTQIKERLSPHQSQTREWVYQEKTLLFIYIPENLYGICKTIETHSKGWKRDGKNCLPLTAQDEERILLSRNGKFEQLSNIEIDLSLINEDVFAVFKTNYRRSRDVKFDLEKEKFLKNIGASRLVQGISYFTNAGYLFFAKNPRELVSGAFVRLLKYDCNVKDFANPGTAIYDNDLDGPLPELLQKVRAFINDSAFFKKYSYRDPNGSGLIEENEYPLVAAEEAIVNAVVHRDYSVPLPIKCIAYKDAFVVVNPGSLKQSSFIPDNFELNGQVLEHYPRNPKLMDWIRIMKDESGKNFVKALSEGTKSMLLEMNQAGLSSPEFNLIGNQTYLALFNNSLEREAKFKRLNIERKNAAEFSNLFRLNLQVIGTEDETTIWEKRKILFNLLKDKLQNTGWFIDRFSNSRLVVHLKGKSFKFDVNTNKFIRVFPAYALQIQEVQGDLFLSIDYDIQVKNVANISTLFNLGFVDFRHRSAQVLIDDVWTFGNIENTNEHYTRIALPEYEETNDILAKNVIPNLNVFEIKKLLTAIKSSVDISREVKEKSFASKPNASKERANKIVTIAKLIGETIFPISQPFFDVSMDLEPSYLLANEPIEDVLPLSLFHISKEPEVRFNDNALYSNIGDGLTKFGSYESLNKKLEIIPLCIKGFESKMESLIALLTSGSFKFKGMERTFGVRLNYAAVVSKNSANEYLDECIRLLQENPEWIGNKDLDRIFLVQIPEDEYPITDENSPYYTLKEFLFENGIPAQMVDSSTLVNQKFKDLNLSLNIVAKTGSTPWVLPNALPNADVFIGLSYSQYKDGDKLYRTMGYANVFNRYGRWQYYKGNGKTFNYHDKHKYLAELVFDTLESLENLAESPKVQIHYSSKFSKRDIDFITRAAQKVKPKVQLIFVWINTGHNVRMFDKRVEGNGSLPRGSYVLFNSNKFYLSTTGYSTLKKTLGTPVMLEINIRHAEGRPTSIIDIKDTAGHVMGLTKLNWASVQSVNGTPVTIKYARSIARLSKVFLKRREKFILHPVLESTPWFL